MPRQPRARGHRAVQELKLGIDEAGIELGRSCERLFRLDGGCYLSSLGITDLLVVLPSGLDLSELLRREAFEDDACSAGERRFRGLQLRRSY